MMRMRREAGELETNNNMIRPARPYSDHKLILLLLLVLVVIIIKSTQGRVVNPLRDLVISLDLPVLQLRELINWQVIVVVVPTPAADQKMPTNIATD
jgi:hypothetical protein